MTGTTISVTLDEDIKEKVVAITQHKGLSIDLIVNDSLRRWFSLEADDPFFSPSNMAVLIKSIQEANDGKFITKTLDELEALAE